MEVQIQLVCCGTALYKWITKAHAMSDMVINFTSKPDNSTHGPKSCGWNALLEICSHMCVRKSVLR